MTSDCELLATFARTNSEAAFAELVRRHVNLVYSAALRQVNGDAHLAQDVAQTVFADLARKASSLARRQNLTGWLYTSAHFAAAKAVRTETRRRDREEKFMREPANEPAPEADWEQIRPALDDAMHDLSETDREAILLRYFENRQYAEIGGKLGLNENAARMRVDRALDKLRAVFTKRGLATSSALAAAISSHAVQLAPAGLSPMLTTAALSTAGTGTFTFFKIMTATQIKLGISALLVAGTASALVVQHQTQARLQAENESLQEQSTQLRADNESLSNRIVSTGDAKPLSRDQLDELLKLRGEVGVLRKQAGQLAKLQGENERLQASLAAAKREPVRGPAVSQDPVEQHRIDTVNAAKMIGLAMRIFSGDHHDQMATNLNDLIEDLGTGQYNSGTNFMGGVQLEDFELVNVGLVTDQHPNMIMLRQKMPTQTPDGRWSRIYGLADGSVQTAGSPDGNFDAWEKQTTEMPAVGQ